MMAVEGHFAVAEPYVLQENREFGAAMTLSVLQKSRTYGQVFLVMHQVGVVKPLVLHPFLSNVRALLSVNAFLGDLLDQMDYGRSRGRGRVCPFLSPGEISFLRWPAG